MYKNSLVYILKQQANHLSIIIDSKQITPDADKLNTDIFHEPHHIDSDNLFNMLCDERQKIPWTVYEMVDGP